MYVSLVFCVSTGMSTCRRQIKRIGHKSLKKKTKKKTNNKKTNAYFKQNILNILFYYFKHSAYFKHNIVIGFFKTDF